MTQTVTDDYGSYEIGFTRAEDLRVVLDYTLTTNSDYPGNATFQAYVASWCDANLGIGDDVLYTKMIDVGYNVAGIDNLSLTLNFFGDPPGTADLTVGPRQIGTVDSGDVSP